MNIWLIISIVLNIILVVCLFFKSALNNILLEVFKSFQEKKNRLLEHDIGLFNLFLKVLPSDGSIKFIDGWHMASSFRWSEFDQLIEFAERWTIPEYKFNNKKIEKLRAELQKKGKRYIHYLGKNSWYLEGNVEYARIPEEWESEQPKRYQEVVKNLHRSADEIVDLHQKLVNQGMEKGLKKTKG